MESGDRASRDRTTEGIVRRLIGGGIALAARFTTSLRVGSGAATLAAFDGADGFIMADGTAAGFYFRNRADATKYGALYRTGTLRLFASETGDLWLIDPVTGLIAQAALTTLAAGTNIALGVTGFAAQGSRIKKPTGEVYAVINLTATGAVAAGSIVATLAAGHYPVGTIGVTATKLALGALGSPSFASLLINGAGQIVTETALANTDTLVATATFMTV
jgi:hypothetical protein